MLKSNIIRVLVAKPGLDGHDRGAKVIARALSEAGMEVIYTGIRQTPEMIVETALQEDVDVIGLSILSGAHMHLFEQLLKVLESQGADDISQGRQGLVDVLGLLHALPRGATLGHPLGTGEVHQHQAAVVLCTRHAVGAVNVDEQQGVGAAAVLVGVRGTHRPVAGAPLHEGSDIF